MPLTVAAAWLVHLFTASGAVLAFLAVRDVIGLDYRGAFFWLYLQVCVDAVDGALARAAQVSSRVPWFNGAKLDDIVDYLAYAFVPALFVWQSLLVPDAWSVPVAAAMLLSSAYGFNRDDAKTDDHFFVGFPSYWNIVVFYLFVLGLPGRMNAYILLALAALVFVRIRCVYPSRTPFLRPLTLALGTAWGVAMLLLLRDYPQVDRTVLMGSLLFPLYYAALSLWFTARAWRGRPSRL